MPIFSSARRVPTIDHLERAGDYCTGTVLEDGVEKPAVWYLLPIHQGSDRFDHATPGSGIHGVTEPPWVIRECHDGSVEIRESIACGRGTKDGEYWHGYLDEGNVWRQL